MPTETKLGHAVDMSCRYLTTAADLTLSIADNNVYVDLTSTGTSNNITLPPASAAAGKIFNVVLTVPNASTCTVKQSTLENSTTIILDGATVVGSHVLTAAGDYVALLSTGLHWVVLNKTVTT